ncbi:MAG: YadA-like family protein [Fusobacterium gastrosuis]|uniref:YadA-like family protein n=1 Tax=Fusobacterium gastrosuis TaxID=1755100 RepID=UPI002972F526|nr:YadA-like family protein [Fusobacteriaceae bacterium]MDY4010987.1 YadA-like family protein [Fusobacterium gastrosuis]MDY5713561.1 YadA-like family protein [Fusobacterium gastrosuis]
MRNKVENILKSSLKRKIRITQALLTVFLITGAISYAEEKIININITNVGEQTGLELGTNSRARGTGAIATGKNSIAIGKNAVATGAGENKETIERKLAENKQKLQDIENAKKALNDKTNELALKQARERATIEAGIRVEEIRKSKEKARIKWQEKVREVTNLKNNSAAFFREHQAKIDDLNSRLSGLSQITGVNISSEAGLTNAATQLKTIAERNTTLNLSLDFYKDYVSSYYKALGDLRENEILRRKMNPRYFSTSFDGNGLAENKLVSKYYSLDDLSSLREGYDIYNKDTFDFDPSGSEERRLYLRALGITSTKFLSIKDINTETIDNAEYSEAKDTGNLLKTKFREYFNKNNDMFLTKDIKEKMYKINDFKVDYRLKTYEITYYQGEYEKTRNTTWLDKKNVALKELANIEKTYNDYITKNENGVYVNNPYYLKELNIKRWQKENIDDIKEKNKITVETLTNELEQALGINKNAVLEREKEIKKLEAQRDQAKANYEKLNPTEADLILAREYERIKREIDTLSNEIVQADERLKVLKKALTLNDLTNIGENQIAHGTNSLAIGNNSIAFGTESATIGENSISVGNKSTTTGQNSLSIGTETITVGDKLINIGYKNTVKGTGTSVIGDPNLIYGNNNHVLGNNNKIGTDTTPKNNVFILGSNVDATNVENAVVLGNNSQAVTGTVSVGAVGTERKIINVADAELSSTSTQAVTGRQLKNLETSLKAEMANIDIDTSNLATKDELNSKANTTDLNNYVKLDGSNINNTAKTALTTKLTEGANLTNPTNTIVTDTIVKASLDTKLDKSEFTGEEISKKLTKGEITSTDLTVTGTGKILDANVGLSIKNGVITKDKLSESLKTEIDSKVNSSDVYTKLETYSKDEVNNLLTGKVSTNDLNNTLNNYVKLDGSNIDNASKNALTTKLTEGANLSNPTNTIVTDTIVKAGLDTKVDKTTYTKDKQALENAINSKANTTDLANKANIDASNIDLNKYTEKLSESSNLNNPANKLITDTKVKDYLSNNYYTSTEVDNKIANVKVETEADIVSKTLDISNGKKRLIGDKNLSIEIKDGAISKDKLDNNLKSEINNKADINGSNIINSKDKEDFRNNIQVFSKEEVESKLKKIADTADLTGEITATEEKGVKGKVIHRHLVENYVNKADMQMRDEMIINNYNEIQKNKIAIAENARRIDQAEKKINKTAALSTAMASMEYPSIGVGEVAVGAGVSGFGGEQGVAVGISYMPIDNLLLGLKYAALVDNRFNGAVSGSVGYKFRLHN